MDDSYTRQVLAHLSNEPVDIRKLQRRVGGPEATLQAALDTLLRANLVEVEETRGRRLYRLRNVFDAEHPASSWGSASAPKSDYHGIVAEALEATLASPDTPGADGDGSKSGNTPLKFDADQHADADGLRSTKPDDDFEFDQVDPESVAELSAFHDPLGDPPAGGETKIEHLDIYWKYISEMQRVRLLTHSEEIELARRVRDGVEARALLERVAVDRSIDNTARLRAVVADGESARTEMILANLRLVVSIAKRYSARGLPLLDLVQEGNLGLMRAVDKYEYALGYRFSTYATWWIRQAIVRALHDQGRVIRVPVHMMETLRRLEQLIRMLTEDLQREPTVEEVADSLGWEWSSEKVYEVQMLTRTALSLEEHMHACEVELGELPVVARDVERPEHRFEQVELRLLLDELLATLSKREQMVLRLRLGLDRSGREHTLQEVGDTIGVTRERIRQIEKAARSKLMKHTARGRLKGYLDG